MFLSSSVIEIRLLHCESSQKNRYKRIVSDNLSEVNPFRPKRWISEGSVQKFWSMWYIFFHRKCINYKFIKCWPKCLYIALVQYSNIAPYWVVKFLFLIKLLLQYCLRHFEIHGAFYSCSLSVVTRPNWQLSVDLIDRTTYSWLMITLRSRNDSSSILSLPRIQQIFFCHSLVMARNPAHNLF